MDQFLTGRGRDVVPALETEELLFEPDQAAALEARFPEAPSGVQEIELKLFLEREYLPGEDVPGLEEWGVEVLPQGRRFPGLPVAGSGSPLLFLVPQGTH
jgi:hypothetical protein